MFRMRGGDGALFTTPAGMAEHFAEVRPKKSSLQASLMLILLFRMQEGDQALSPARIAEHFAEFVRPKKSGLVVQ